MAKVPLVSIILPVKNGEPTLRRSLDSLLKQTYKNIQIVIIDNYSSDQTLLIVKEYRLKDKRIKYYQKGPERASQMNFGVSKATGKYIFITNCDFIVDKKFIELAVKKCEEEGFKTCNGHIKSETKGFWSRVKGLERRLYVNDSLMETSLFYRKDIFLKLGGFDEKMLGVEEEFQHRLDEAGIKMGIINSFQTHIDEIDSLKEIVLKSFYYGLNDANYFRKHPIHAFVKRFPIRKAFIRNFGSLMSNFDIFIGFIIFKVLQYIAGTAGLILGLVSSARKSRVQRLIYGK